MLKSVTSFVTAVALLMSQAGPSFALDWRRSEVWSDARLHNSDTDREMVATAYVRMPFARTADEDAVKYGLGVAARLPKSRQIGWSPYDWNEAPVMDLGFNANGFDDFRVSGVGIRDTQRRLSAAGDAEASIWWTLGVMVAVGLAAAAIIVFSEKDGNATEDAAAQ